MGPASLSEKVLEHVLSAHVVLEQIKLKCKECGESFKRPKEYNLHLVAHLSRVVKKDEKRFIKRFQCPDCDQKFVLQSTLEAHAEIHAAFPHVCYCGVGYYLRMDLNAHKQLVHADEIKKEINKLTFRKARALKNEFWVPAINYNGPKTEEENIKPKTGVRPRLKAELRAYAPKSKGKKKSGATKRGQGPERTADGRFLCKLCGKSFSQAAAVYTHYKRHEGIKEFVCPHCGKEHFDKHALALHVRTHTGERPLGCAHCGKRFADPSALARHCRLHTGEKPYACAHCDKRFSDASAKIVHQRRHNQEKDYPCDICHKRFYTFSNLRVHKQCVHSEERKYECEICHKCFKFKPYLVLHQKTHEEERVKRFECDDCGLKSLSKQNIERHIKEKHLRNKVFKCTECDRKFYNNFYRQRHMSYKHSGPKKFECDYCGEKFPVRGDLFKHIIALHLNIKCVVCSKPFASSRDLKEHRRQSCLRCLVCGITFQTKARLLEHSNTAHNKNIRNYTCHICLKAYHLKSILGKHIKYVHGNGKIAECNDCGLKFPLKSNLANHIFKKHLSYVYCSDCMKHFYSVTDLKKHKRKGCSEEKYICDMCNMHFKSKARVANHIMVHHLGLKNYECQHCHKKYPWRSSLVRHLEMMHLSKNKKSKRKRL